jgi:pSer/pThr/pTyr-binding forkhead associated (FHA) protein
MLGKNPGKSPLDRIENRLQSLIEGSLSVLVAGGNTPRTLAHALSAAMYAELQQTENGQLVAPNSYIIQVHPDRLPYWQADPRILNIITQHFSQAAQEDGISFLSTPIFHLATDPALSANDVRVLANLRTEALSNTAVIQARSPDTPAGGIDVSEAFLIINGNQVFPLRQPVINIGRRLDNHLSIDDPRVSRSHAQLRSIHGRYVLFDLNSTGGTYVNGQRVNQYNLNPGDVISLAGVPLIFGQENIPSNDQATHQKISPGKTQSLRKKVEPGSHSKHQP